MPDIPRVRAPLNEQPFGPGGQFSTAWLRYFQQLADQLVTMDQLSFVSSEAAAALASATATTNASLATLSAASADHATRITALETRMAAVEARLLAAGIP